MVIYQVLVSLHNLFFHPLRTYSGSKTTAVSVFPVVWAYASGRYPFWLAAQHEKYGPCVRISPNELSFTGAQAWKDIYGSVRSASASASVAAGGSGVKKTSVTGITSKWPLAYGDGILPDCGTTIASEVSDVEHARVRKTFGAAFSERALREQRDGVFGVYPGLLVQKLRELIMRNPEEKVDIVKWMDLTS
jgi:hypothetical protein